MLNKMTMWSCKYVKPFLRINRSTHLETANMRGEYESVQVPSDILEYSEGFNALFNITNHIINTILFVEYIDAYVLTSPSRNKDFLALLGYCFACKPVKLVVSKLSTYWCQCKLAHWVNKFNSRTGSVHFMRKSFRQLLLTGLSNIVLKRNISFEYHYFSIKNKV